MMTILLADDKKELCSAMRLMLETRLRGAAIAEAYDMEQVLTQVERSLPGCVILDWELPGYPNRERLALLRGLVPDLKVIALSVRPESETQALESGADAFVSKTEAPDKIVEIIQRFCSIRQEAK